MSASNKVPFLDLVSLHAPLKEEFLEVFRTAVDTGGFIGGPNVQGFEEEFAQFCNTAHCVGVGSGTDALRFAYLAAGIGAGDAVVTVSHTFIATAEAISQTGARPVFVDIDEATCNMDPALLRRYLETECDHDAASGRLTERKSGLRVAAVVPVHLYGQMADMDPILDVAAQFGLTVIEDASQAHGAQYYSKKENRWRRAGQMGHAAGFSFYPGKNLGALGEGGAVTTNDAELAAKVRRLRDHGQSRKYHHEVEGYNGRLDAVQAGCLRIKLRHLPEWTEQRRAAAARYRELFAGQDGRIGLPHEADWAKHVYHLYVVRAPHREELMQQLGEAGIGTGIHYPVPLHLQEAYGYLGYGPGDFPVTERVAAEIVSLPMFPQLTAEQQGRVVSETLRALPAAAAA